MDNRGIMKKMDDKVLDVLRKCYYCHKPNAMSRCSRCRLTYYCGVACQKADWKEHKKHCINANIFKEMQAMETGYKSGDPSAELPLVDVQITPRILSIMMIVAYAWGKL